MTESRAVSSIATISRSVLRRAKHAHYARAICGALGTFTLALACALERGSRLGDPEVLALGALLSIAAFVCWIRSESIEARAVLERIDERLHLSGAFLSAHESCAKSPGAPLTQLGAAKLLQRVRPSQALEAAVPHTLGFAALPLIGLLVLVQTVQVRDARRSRAGRMTVELGTVADRLADIERMNRESLSESQRRELAEIQRAAEIAAEDAARQFIEQASEDAPAAEGRREDYCDQMRSVADDLVRMASEAQPGSALAEELCDAAAEAEAFVMESGPKDASGSRAEAGDGRFGGSEEGGGGGDSPSDALSAEPLGTEFESAGSGDLAAGDAAAGGSELGASELADPAGFRETDAASTKGGATVASGEIMQGTSQRLAEGDQRPGVGIIQPSEEGGDQGIVPSGGADGAPLRDAPVPSAAEGLLDRSSWWTDRDDAIVRAWLARRAPR